METNWLWDKDVTDEQAKAVLSHTNNPKFVSYAALLLSRSDSAKEIFHNYLSKQDFFSSWTQIKRQMRKDSWNNPRIEYWQAIYDTLKEEMPELKSLKVPQIPDVSASFIPREIGNKIKALRQQMGWTQGKLAERLKISQQIISRIESGNQNVSVETLNNICAALGVPFEKFFLVQPDQTEERLNISPFSSKSPEEFVRMVFEIIEKSKEFDPPEFYDGTGDKQRDIVAFRYNQVGKKEKWFFQCKRYASISFSIFRNELDKISEYSQKETDYKPDVIVFATACKVSAYCKDKVKEYGKRIGFQEIEFWTDVELIAKAKVLGIYDDFFSITQKDLKQSSRDIQDHVTGLFTQAGLLTTQDKSKKDTINKAIDEAVEEIHRGNFSRAKDSLLTLKGKVIDSPGEYSNELARIYNNLGVCFNRIETDDRDIFQAEKYFLLALDKNPKMLNAKTNLAAVHLNKGTGEDFKQAYLIANDLWNRSDKEEPAIFEILIWAKFRYQSAQEAILFYEKSSEAQKLVKKHEKLLNMVGAIYLGSGNIDKAKTLADQALKVAPKAPHNLLLKAKVLMSYAEKQDISSGPFEVIPKLKSSKNITEAVEFLNKALEELREKERDKIQKNRFIEAEIKYDLSICLLWLRRFESPEYRDIRKSIELSRLNPVQQRQLNIHDALLEIESRNPEAAYLRLTQSEEWPGLSYKERKRLAHIFFLQGFPRQSKDIYLSIESEAEKQKDFLFYLDMSLNEVLLSEKSMAIQYAKRALDLAKGTSEEQRVLSHSNALMLRYARDNEVDRLMSGLSEYDNKYPQDKVIRSFKAIDESGKVTEEFKTILLKQKEWYENVKRKFRDEPAPSYFLEKTLSRTYVEILSFRYGDELDFTIPLILPDRSFEENLLDFFEKAEGLVFDYASLLNLSKMNLLGYLEKLGKAIYISKKLFEKVQDELLQVEQEDLRNLWRFLTNSKTIRIAENSTENKYAKLLDDWLVESIYLAKENRATFVVDDLRLLNFMQSEEEMKVCNSFIILKSLLRKKWIDTKIYSTSVGDLAERFYTFLPFSGEDFFQIVMEDKSKITWRSYHLVNEMFLPGSIATSFTSVFVKFIDLLWKTGSLANDKVNWLSFLTERIMDFIRRQGEISDQHDLEQMLPDFVQMWIIAVQRSSKDEILLIENKLGEIFKLPTYDTLKDNLSRFIKAKKTSLGVG